MRFSLAASGGESEIALATNGVAAWRGEFIEPRGGYRAILHLQSGGAVESLVTGSWWRSTWQQVSGSTP